MASFSDAAKLRDVIKKIARTQVKELAPQPRMGDVWHIDRENNVIRVKFPGDDTLLTVSMSPGNQPQSAKYDDGIGNAPADLVRVGGGNGSYFLMDVISAASRNILYDEAIDTVYTDISPLVNDYIIEYAVNASETVAPTTGWSTAQPTRTPGTYIWFRTTVTRQGDAPSTTAPALLTGNDGAAGSSAYTWIKYGNDIIRNGDFSKPTASDPTIPDQWTRTVAGQNWYNAAHTEAWDSVEGAVALTTGITNLTGPSIGQLVDVTPGDLLHIRLKLKGSSALNGIYVILMNAAGNGELVRFTGLNGFSVTTSYADYSGTAVVPAGATQGRLVVLAYNKAIGDVLYVKEISHLVKNVSDSPEGTNSIGIAYNQTTTVESTNANLYDWSLVAGTPAAIVDLTATTQVLTSPSGGGATNPATAVVTGTATNTTISVWEYSVNGAAFSATVPPGVSRTGNVVTITGATMTARTITVRMADADGVADTLTVAEVIDGATGSTGATGGTGATGAAGADAYTVLLSNEAQVFPGTTAAAVAGSAVSAIIAYRNTVQQAATIGTIVGMPTGMTVTLQNNGTTTAQFTVTVTTSLVQQSGTLTVPVTVGGINFTKSFAWSVSYTGATGSTGSTGATGAAGAPAAQIDLTATTQVLVSPPGGGATTPATATVTGVATNTTITAWTYSVDSAAFSATVPPGVSRTGNVVTITGSTMTARTIAVRMADAAGIADTITVAEVLDGATGSTGSTGATGGTGATGAAGADAITAVLTNEAHVFPGTTNTAVAGSAISGILAYKNATQQSVTIGTITAQGGGALPTGMTSTIQNNGTTTAQFTITVTTSLVQQNGVVSVPLTIAGVAVTKLFVWSVSYVGATGSTGATGSAGAPASTVDLTATAQVLTSPAGGVGATTPTTSTVTGTPTNTTISTWDYSVDSAAFSTSVPAGVSRTGNVVTVTGSTMTARTIAIRATGASGVADTLTVAKVLDGATGSTGATGGTGSTGATGAAGADAITAVLTNEAHVFPGTTNTAVAASAISGILAYKNATQQSVTIGTITALGGGALPTGMTATIQNNGTTTAQFTVAVTTSLVQQNGIVSVPLTIAGVAVTKLFVWSVSYVGAAGATGSTGSTGATGAAGTPASMVNLVATSQILSVAAGGAITPATATVTGTAVNTTISTWDYSVNGAAFSTTAPPGISIAANVVTVTGSTMTAKTIAIRATGATGVSDTLTVAKVTDGATGSTGATGGTGSTGAAGADAITAVLTNEAHVFPGTTNTAVAASAISGILAYKNATQQSVTIGTITAQGGGALPTGMTATIQNNSTTTAQFTITVTTSLVQQNGVVSVPLTIAGVAVTKLFVWSVSYTGATGSTGGTGAAGTPASIVNLIATAQVLSSPAGGVGATTPTTAVITGSAINTTISSWDYNTNGAGWSATLPAGVGIVGNVVTITGASMTARTIAVRATGASGVTDTITVAKANDGATGSTGSTGSTGAAGADAYTVILSNEAQVMAGTVNTAVTNATAAVSAVIAYKAAVQQAVTINSVTGSPTGMSVTIQNNGTTTAQFTVAVTTALVQQSGTLTVSLTIGGINFTKQFAWSVSYTGATGSTGSTGGTGPQGVSVTAITPYWAQVTTGAAAPAIPTTTTPVAPWVAAEPAYAVGTELYVTEKVTYSSGAPGYAYTTVAKSSSYIAAENARNEALSAQAQGSNLVNDGNFEFGTALLQGLPANIFRVSGGAYSGNYYVRMKRTTPDPFPNFNAPLVLFRNRTYLLRVVARVPTTAPSAQGLYARVNIDGASSGPVLQPSVPNDNVWRTYEMQFSTTPTTALIVTNMNVQANGTIDNAAATIEIDAVLLTDITEAAIAGSQAEANNSTGTNPFFDTWPDSSATPTGYAQSAGVMVKETTVIKTPPYAIRYNVVAGVSNYTSSAVAWAGMPNHDYITVTLDFLLISGDLSGAGMFIRWTNTVAAIFDVQLRLSDFVPTPDLNKWYRLTKTVKRPSTFTGTFQRVEAYIMGGYAPLGTVTAKNIVFDQLAGRPATNEEILAYTGTQNFYSTGTVPVSRNIGDTWVRETGGTKRQFIAKSVGADAITAGEWEIQDSDGVAPASSPTPTISPLGYNGVTIKWPAVTNADPVRYKVFFDTVNPPVQQLTDTTALQASTSVLPNGTQLVNGSQYFARVQAYDADGSATIGSVIGGGPVSIPSTAVSEDIMVAGTVYTKDAYIGTLSAEQIETAVADIGLAMLGNLVLNGGFTINGLLNNLFGTLTANANISPPSRAPILTDVSPAPVNPLFDSNLYHAWNSGWVRDGTSWVGTQAGFPDTIVSVSDAGVVTTLKTAAVNTEYHSVTKVGSLWYVMVWDWTRLWGGGYQRYFIKRFNTSWVEQTPEWEFTTDNAMDANGWASGPLLSSNATQLIVGRIPTTGANAYKAVFRHLNATTGALEATVVSSIGVTTAASMRDFRSFLATDADYGSLRYICYFDNSAFTGRDQKIFNSTGVYQPTEAWTKPTAIDTPQLEVGWEPVSGRLYQMGWNSDYGEFLRIPLSKNKTAVSRTVKQTFYDAVGTSTPGGPGTVHETTASPSATRTQPARWYQGVSLLTPTYTTGDDDTPKKNRVYINNILQTPDLADFATTLTYEVPVVTPATDSPPSNQFDQISNPGRIKSEKLDGLGVSPVWDFKGDGPSRFGPYYIDLNGDEAFKPYYMDASLSVAQSIANGTATIQIGNSWTNATPGTTLIPGDDPWTYSAGVWTIPKTGRYLISIAVHYASNATGVRAVFIQKNGADVKRGQIGAGSGGGTTVTCIAELDYNAGDTLSFGTFQTSGGALALTVGASLSWCTARRVGMKYS